MNRPIKYQQDIESALDAALLREKKLCKDIFEMNDKCVAMRRGLQAKAKRLEKALEYAHCQLLNINAARKASNKFEVNLDLLDQALKANKKEER